MLQLDCRSPVTELALKSESVGKRVMLADSALDFKLDEEPS